MLRTDAQAFFRRKSERVRFLRKCRIVGKCWVWTGAKRGNYGVFNVSGSIRNAHRVAYVLFREPVHEGVSVLHSCGNKLCCNPDHLFLEVQEKYLSAERIAA